MNLVKTLSTFSFHLCIVRHRNDNVKLEQKTITTTLQEKKRHTRKTIVKKEMHIEDNC